MANSRSRWKTLVCYLLTAGILFAAACGGSLYKVKTPGEAPLADAASGAEAGSISLRAVPLLNDEETQDLFEANLLLVGLLPVRVELANGSGGQVEVKRIQFRLRDGEGRQWKVRSAKEAISRILDANGVTLYNPQSRKKFDEDFRAHALSLDTPLAQGEKRAGLIFFQTPKKEAVSNPRGLVLSVEKLPQPLELSLN